MTMTNTPKTGDVVYVNSSFFLTPDEDEFVGGMATVIEVEERSIEGRLVPFIRVEEDPDNWYNWELLEPQQEELANYFGKEWAFADPDPHLEINHWD